MMDENENTPFSLQHKSNSIYCLWYLLVVFVGILNLRSPNRRDLATETWTTWWTNIDNTSTEKQCFIISFTKWNRASLPSIKSLVWLVQQQDHSLVVCWKYFLMNKYFCDTGCLAIMMFKYSRYSPSFKPVSVVPHSDVPHFFWGSDLQILLDHMTVSQDDTKPECCKRSTVNINSLASLLGTPVQSNAIRAVNQSIKLFTHWQHQLHRCISHLPLVSIHILDNKACVDTVTPRVPQSCCHKPRIHFGRGGRSWKTRQREHYPWAAEEGFNVPLR